MSLIKTMMESSSEDLKSVLFSERCVPSLDFYVEEIDSVLVNGFKLDSDIVSLLIESEDTDIISRDGNYVKKIYITELKLIDINNKTILISRLKDNEPINIIIIKGLIKTDEAVLDEVKIYYPGQCNIYCKVIKDDMGILREYAAINKLRVGDGQG